jgi:hypothetical protein
MADNESTNQTEPVSPAAGEPGPRRKKYSDGHTPKTKQPFAYQAAAIAFWAPVGALLLWILSRFIIASAQNAGDAKLQADLAFYILGAEIILMVLGLVMGVVALFSIRKLGKKGLFVRPLVGVVIAAVSLSYIGYFFYALKNEPARRLALLKSKLVGDWEIEGRAENTPITIRLSLRANHTGSWKITGPKPLDLSGAWDVQVKDRALVLRLNLDAPQNQKVKVEGFLREISDDQLTLANVTADGKVVNQTFNRVKELPPTLQ